MPGVLQPTQSSRENILSFLETIEDEKLRQLLKEQLENILAVGKHGTSSASTQRDLFYQALTKLIESSTPHES